jgi:two-component system response regulator AtoC
MPFPELTQELKRAMTAYAWPGNVRELENGMRKLLILGDPHTMTWELEAKSSRKPPAVPAVVPLEAA